MKGYVLNVFFFQAEDGIRDLVRSRGLGDVYKRQDPLPLWRGGGTIFGPTPRTYAFTVPKKVRRLALILSLIHI